MTAAVQGWTWLVLLCAGLGLWITDSAIGRRFRFTTLQLIAMLVVDAVATIAAIMLVRELMATGRL